MAVLDVIEEEDLMGNASRTGGYLKEGLESLAKRFEIIGDVRGRGLFIGAELVLDRNARTPAPGEAARIVNRLRHRGILLSTDGPAENVLKIKPPMVIGKVEVDMFLRVLEDELGGL
jgi:4-aminobutyrate aminotransferase-like enzyme